MDAKSKMNRPTMLFRAANDSTLLKKYYFG